ncbi:UNVERIFIED_CONTAM: hypothetical protein Sradi_7268700 [Sesamum radiatum]|uniref:DUF4283 domain-containing protein n=1 Tax=Sesamum radiatum TaxID=300843 RepID=A0AAW2IIQ7_SESRA
MASFMLNPDEFPPLTRGNSPELTRPSQESAQSRAQTTATTSVQPKQPEFPKVFLANQNPSPIGTVNTINGRPTITFSDDETHSLAAAFRFALVGKFSHGSPPFSQLHQLLAKTGIKGTFTVSMINRKHALIIPSIESDYSRLWLRRIWFLNGFPMRVLKWSPTFSTAHESPIVPIWAFFLSYRRTSFKKDVLFSLAKFIGTPLQIADSTFNQSNLSKARVCIEIDLLKPLVEEIDINIFGSTIVQKMCMSKFLIIAHFANILDIKIRSAIRRVTFQNPHLEVEVTSVLMSRTSRKGTWVTGMFLFQFLPLIKMKLLMLTMIPKRNDPEISEQEPYVNEVVGGLEIEA